MRSAEDDKLRRDRVRAVFAALDALAKSVPSAEGWAPMDGAVAQAKDLIAEAFGDDNDLCDVVSICESCLKPIVAGDMGTRSSDGVYLCAEDAPSWADCKEQWDEIKRQRAAGEFDGAAELDDEDIEQALKSYDGHIAAGGSPEDKPLYVMGD